MRQSKHALFSMAKKLFLLHLVFIIITVIMLNFGPLAIISSLIYILALFLAGLQGTRIHILNGFRQGTQFILT
jgi:uncharacterized membrane protein YoaK (UPF0700 family)